jgi:hypothetical protein
MDVIWGMKWSKVEDDDGNKAKDVGVINQGRKKIIGRNIWHSNAKHKNGLKQMKVRQVDCLNACQGHEKSWE